MEESESKARKAIKDYDRLKKQVSTEDTKWAEEADRLER